MTSIGIGRLGVLDQPREMRQALLEQLRRDAIEDRLGAGFIPPSTFGHRDEGSIGAMHAILDITN